MPDTIKTEHMKAPARLDSAAELAEARDFLRRLQGMMGGRGRAARIQAEMQELETHLCDLGRREVEFRVAEMRSGSAAEA